MANDLITPNAACSYFNSIYCNNTLNTTHCISCWNWHFSQNIWSFYTLNLLMDIHDMNSLQDNTPNEYFIKFPLMRTLMPNVYKLFLTLNIQHVRLRFNNGLSSSFMEFEKDIVDIFGEINAYIPQFTTRSDTSTNREKCWIFVFTVVFWFPLIDFTKVTLSRKISREHCITFLTANNISVSTSFPIKEICCL